MIECSIYRRHHHCREIVPTMSLLVNLGSKGLEMKGILDIIQFSTSGERWLNQGLLRTMQNWVQNILSFLPLFLVCLHGYLMSFIDVFGYSFLAGCLVDLFYKWVISLAACNGRENCEWYFGFIFFQIALCCPQLVVSHQCRRAICLHVNPQHFFWLQRRYGKIINHIIEDFFLHRTNWTQVFCVHLLFSISSLRTHLLKIHEEKYLAFPTLKYL